jgi:hypothetical protein
MEKNDYWKLCIYDIFFRNPSVFMQNESFNPIQPIEIHHLDLEDLSIESFFNNLFLLRAVKVRTASVLDWYIWFYWLSVIYCILAF